MTNICSLRQPRIAIVGTHTLPYSHEICRSPESSSLIHNVTLGRTRIRLLVPQWNLPFVLDLLMRPPFELLEHADLKHLALRTVSLLYHILAVVKPRLCPRVLCVCILLQVIIRSRVGQIPRS